MAEIRTYETFDIRWANGSRWTGYGTRAEAQATVDSCRALGRRRGEVECRAFSVAVPACYAAVYRPGVSSHRLYSLIDADGYVRFRWLCDAAEADRFATRHALPGDRLVDGSGRIIATGADLYAGAFA